jgi:hypothetical protein
MWKDPDPDPGGLKTYRSGSRTLLYFFGGALISDPALCSKDTPRKRKILFVYESVCIRELGVAPNSDF